PLPDGTVGRPHRPRSLHACSSWPSALFPLSTAVLQSSPAAHVLALDPDELPRRLSSPHRRLPPLPPLAEMARKPPLTRPEVRIPDLGFVSPPLASHLCPLPLVRGRLAQPQRVANGAADVQKPVPGRDAPRSQHSPVRGPKMPPIAPFAFGVQNPLCIVHRV